MLHKAIEGYEDYLISNTGQVYSLKRRKYLSACVDNHGYLCVTLCKNNHASTKNIHRLLAEAFILNPDNKPCVDHINRNRLDNRLENLRWVTYSENNTNKDHLTARRKAKGHPIVEKINDEVSIGYLSFNSVQNIPQTTFHRASKKGNHFKTHNREFYWGGYHE